MPHRHKVAKQLLEALIVEAYTETDPRSAGVRLLDNDALGRARLLEGNFVDMWDAVKDCNVIYLNNYGRWFKFVSLFTVDQLDICFCTSVLVFSPADGHCLLLHKCLTQNKKKIRSWRYYFVRTPRCAVGFSSKNTSVNCFSARHIPSRSVQFSRRAV